MKLYIGKKDKGFYYELTDMNGESVDYFEFENLGIEGSILRKMCRDFDNVHYEDNVR